MTNKIIFEDILCCSPCTFFGFSLPVLASDCIGSASSQYNRTRISEIEHEIYTIEQRIAAYNVHRLPANLRVGLFHINNKTREKRLSTSTNLDAPERIAIENTEHDNHIPPRIVMM